MTFKVIIVDDEPLARSYIRNMLADYSDMAIIAECGDGISAASEIRDKNPDLVFLDIQMPEKNGLQVIEDVGLNNMPLTIFVTAFEKYAIRAFDNNAFDYLLKPFNKIRFKTSLERAKEQLKNKNSSELAVRLLDLINEYKVQFDGEKLPIEEEPKQSEKSATSRVYKGQIPVKVGRRVRLIKVADIDWIEAADDFVNIHVGEKSHLLGESMGKLLRKLDSDKFVRIHRSAIVNIDRVNEFRRLGGGDYEVILYNGVKLRLSRRRKRNLESLLGRSL